MVITQALKPGDIYVSKNFYGTNIFLVEKYDYNAKEYRVRNIGNSNSNDNLGERFYIFGFWRDKKILFPAKVGD